MRNLKFKLMSSVVTAAMLAGTLIPLSVLAAPEGGFGWEEVDGNKYWYENGVKQGLEGRGKEIADPDTGEWYWLDSVDGGKMATDKDLYQESKAGQWAENFVEGDWEASTGKWVRYDVDGHMVKGWGEKDGNTYYFDLTYGTMAKGYATIDGQEYYFNTATGVKERELGSVPEGNGWKNVDGVEYWYENGIRQGYSIDASYRGKEIYDPDSDAWYWLDNIDEGKKAVSKDVYQESKADDTGTIGKWVRYDAEGHMVKGWNTNADGTYYFDPVYGTMAKGIVEIDGVTYVFDEESGILQEPEEDPLSPGNVYAAMIAMKESYPEGMRWTNDNYYRWNGGIYSGGYGCAGFAFMLSDQAFGDLRARMHYDFTNIRVGDILRVDNNTHSVIVLEVVSDGVIVAEGNYNSSIHWGRKISTEELQATGTYVMTRYPED